MAGYTSEVNFDVSKGNIAIVLPYFGKFPNYFDLWLRSCSINSEIDWLLITDIKDSYSFPKNVKVIDWDFKQVVSKIKQVLGEDVEVPVPHKLCDIKVFYGWVFAELLNEYKFWGYCDADVIFGKIADFITPTLLHSYDKIFGLGHFCIMPNTERVLSVIRESSLEEEVRNRVLRNPRTTLFDEWFGAVNINRYFQQRGLNIYNDPGVISDIHSSSPHFKRSFWDSQMQKGIVEEEKNLLIWNIDAGLYRYWIKNNCVEQEPVLYVHLKERKMSVDARLQGGESNNWAVFPSGFLEWPEDRIPSRRDFNSFSEGFWKYCLRRGRRKWRNAKYLLKMRLGKS